MRHIQARTRLTEFDSKAACTNSAGDLFDVEQVREGMAVIMDKFDITPQDIYTQMSAKDQSPENEAQVLGWFDGSVKRSPKALVSAFMYAVIKTLENSANEIGQTCLSDYQSEPHPALLRH